MGGAPTIQPCAQQQPRAASTSLGNTQAQSNAEPARMVPRHLIGRWPQRHLATPKEGCGLTAYNSADVPPMSSPSVRSVSQRQPAAGAGGTFSSSGEGAPQASPHGRPSPMGGERPFFTSKSMYHQDAMNEEQRDLY